MVDDWDCEVVFDGVIDADSDGVDSGVGDGDGDVVNEADDEDVIEIVGVWVDCVVTDGDCVRVVVEDCVGLIEVDITVVTVWDTDWVIDVVKVAVDDKEEVGLTEVVVVLDDEGNNDELAVDVSVDENDNDRDADDEIVKVELGVNDNVPVKLELDEAVFVILILCDIVVVAEPLILWDAWLVKVELYEIVDDILELGVIVRDGVGELESTEPAPAATNAMLPDCIQLVTVAGFVSPTV